MKDCDDGKMDEIGSWLRGKMDEGRMDDKDWNDGKMVLVLVLVLVVILVLFCRVSGPKQADF